MVDIKKTGYGKWFAGNVASGALLVLLLCSSFTPWIMLILVLPMTPNPPRVEVLVNLTAWLMFTRRPLPLMVLWVSTCYDFRQPRQVIDSHLFRVLSEPIRVLARLLVYLMV